MPGTRSKRASADDSEEYREACAALADALGYPFNEVWKHWQYLYMLHQYEQNLPADAAQERAWIDVQTMLDKRGKTEPS